MAALLRARDRLLVLPLSPTGDRTLSTTTIHNSAKTPEVIMANSSTSPTPDPFANLEDLRLSQSFIESAGAKKLLTTVPVRKPHKQEWVQTHPGADYRMELAFIQLKEEREICLVHPRIAVDIQHETFSATLYTTINRQRVVFLWPVRLPPREGKELDWNRSAREAAELSMSKWIRISSNMSLGAYDTFESTGNIPPPEWPEHTFQDLLRKAFPPGQFIDSLDHPVLKSLRGE